jgi:hypothetical protein
MNEVFPVVAGVVIGLATQLLIVSRWRTHFLVGLSLVFGLAATVVSGEVELSWGFLPIDVALVLLSAAATAVVTAAVRSRTPRLP